MFRVITPITCKDPGHYSRLFPPDEHGIAWNDSRLECLAWAMCDKETHAAEEEVPAAYTYLGQFIDHDMTLEPKTPQGESIEPCDMPNRRTNWLNLDAVYGSTFEQLPAGALEKDGLHFRLGDVLTSNREKFDVPLDNNSQVPLVADKRNIENAILRQVHAMFLKLHNLAMTETNDFAEARRRVCHQYQWLVMNDFVDKLCQKRGSNEPTIDWKGNFSIPVEFARAAFRFGHSMVRPKYDLGAEVGDSVNLLCLFGSEDSRGPLREEHAVPWSSFFLRDASTSEFAKPIDTSVVEPLFYLPLPLAKLFRSDLPPQGTFPLPHKTLQRGAASHLPSGEFVRRVLGADVINNTIPGYDLWANMRECGLDPKQAPLWYYILLEAEEKQGGKRLGPVGSFIVREVIQGALQANKNSYLNECPPNWTPGDWPMPNGAPRKQIRTFYDLAVVVNLAK